MGLDIYFYVGFAALFLASITDLKRREVPDWINFGLIFFGIIFSAIISLQSQDMFPLFGSLVGVGIAFIIAAFMFYTGQWGGGDAKMLMGLGALFGITYSLSDTFINLVFNIIIAGAIYGAAWSVYLSVRNWKNLTATMRALSLKKNYILFKRISFGISSLFIILAVLIRDLRVSFASLAILVLFTYYLFIYIKSIEEACMIKSMMPKDLTEGDWIVDDVKVGGKKFLDKGTVISQKELDMIEHHKKSTDYYIMIRRRILFIPITLSKRLSELKEKDIILEHIEGLGLKPDSIIKKKEFDSIRISLRKILLHDIKIRRKTLFSSKRIRVSPYDLKIGDVLENDIKTEEYLICSSNDLGIEKYQIEELKRLHKEKKIEKVKVKEGIPFIPSFLLAYLMTFFMPSILVIVIGFAI